MTSNQPSFWEEAAQEPDRYHAATLWYDSTDRRLVVLVKGQRVPVVEPVLPGLEVVPDVVRHVAWLDPVTPANQAHVASCASCTAQFGGTILGGAPGKLEKIVGKGQPGLAGKSPKVP